MSVDGDALGRAVGPLVDLVDRTPPPDDLLGWMSVVADAALPLLHVDAVGVLLLDELDAPRVAVTSAPAAAAAERAQLRCGEGPSIESLRAGIGGGMDDLSGPHPYRRLAGLLVATPVRAMRASPVRVAGAVVGSLDTMMLSRHHWTDAEARAQQAYAGVVATALQVHARAGAADATRRALRARLARTGADPS